MASELAFRMREDGYLMRINDLEVENTKLREEKDRLLMNASPTAGELWRVRTAWKKDRAENAKLRDENTKLREENAKLRKLGEQYEMVLADYRSTVAKLQNLAGKMAHALDIYSGWCDRNCAREFECDFEPCPLAKELQELGVEA